MKNLLTLLFVAFAAIGASAQKTYVAYTPHDSVIANPERGARYAIWAGGSSGSVANLNTIINNRRDTVHVTMYHYLISLHSHMEGDIPDKFLQNIETNFSLLRQGGAKCVLRVYYGDSDKYPPYDPPLPIVLRHIEQLKPILRRNADVIDCMEAGFIGLNGEWANTTSYKSGNYYSDGRTIIDAMLDALPVDRFVCVRTPNQTVNLFGLQTTDFIEEADAHSGSDYSRMGGFNDCFLFTFDDGGTFGGKAEMRRFWEQNSKYFPMGGEMSGDPYPGQERYSDYENAVKQLENYHYDTLNTGGNIWRKWKEQGTYAVAIRRFGYRFVLLDGQFTTLPEAGGKLDLTFTIRNDGFSAPHNPRNVEIVLLKGGEEKARYQLDEDPQFWHPHVVQTVEASLDLPDDLEAGDYQLCLHLADPYASIHDNPNFSVRCANVGVWMDSKGYNLLGTLTVKSQGASVAEKQGDANVTAVEKVETLQQKNVIYDLQGRPVQNPANGLYILNGKKVFIK